MEKVYTHLTGEKKWYELWEKNGYFTQKKDKEKKPFCILLPLPNANDPMHMGHALFTVQDIMIRYHRMRGEPTLWLPGGDHAGIETQYVFEKRLKKEGKSRFDFDRETLYGMIASFVEENKTLNRNQMKRLGFSLDWTRYRYSLDPDIVAIVYDTFRKLHGDDLVYRDERLVNYCTKCGTSFSDLEVKHQEQTDPLYYLKYGPFTLATVRPETKFGDTAVAVHPKDKRYEKWIGKTVTVTGLLGKFSIQVIADEAIDPKFGTGVAKVTPAHDFTDFEIAKRHHLPLKKVIDFTGRLIGETGPYAGLKIKEARKKVAEDLQTKGLLDHTQSHYVHTVATCYKCATVLEPLPIPQWYVKTRPLANPAIRAVRDGRTKIVPLKRFEKMYFDWMEHILDWNISRQIVWGPRIPVWYCLDCNPNIVISYIVKEGKKVSESSETILKQKRFEDMLQGLQTVRAPITATYALEGKGCTKCKGKHMVQETDTFDTWFLSAQWPITALGYPNGNDFAYFYPTSVLDTMWDILFFWVARMMMLGLYRTKEVPFRTVHIHCRVVDQYGKKMSKSRGNVMNPIDMVEKFGADALRMALIFGTAPGSDIAISEDKIRGMRNFANKLWNIGRFIKIQQEVFREKKITVPVVNPKKRNAFDPYERKYLSKVSMLQARVTKQFEAYRFDQAAGTLYEFIWHEFADRYIERVKPKLQECNAQTLAVTHYIFETCLTLLHPFMPFITEEIASQLNPERKTPLIISDWPSQ